MNQPRDPKRWRIINVQEYLPSGDLVNRQYTTMEPHLDKPGQQTNYAMILTHQDFLAMVHDEHSFRHRQAAPNDGTTKGRHNKALLNKKILQDVHPNGILKVPTVMVSPMTKLMRYFDVYPTKKGRDQAAQSRIKDFNKVFRGEDREIVTVAKYMEYTNKDFQGKEDQRLELAMAILILNGRCNLAEFGYDAALATNAHPRELIDALVWHKVKADDTHQRIVLFTASKFQTSQAVRAYLRARQEEQERNNQVQGTIVCG